MYKDSRDKRISRVKLTKKGDTFKNIFKNISETMYNIQYRNMSEEEISTLKNLLEKLLANFYC